MSNSSAVAETGRQADWGDEVMPNVFMIRRTGSAANAATKTGLGILANTLANDGSTIDYHKVHDRIKDRKSLVRKLKESNEYMIEYLAKEKRRRARRLRQLEQEKSSDGMPADDKEEEDEADLPPITPEEDDGIIESSILENELIIKDANNEIKILMEMVAVHHCIKGDAGTDAELERMAMELLKSHDTRPSDDNNNDSTSDSEADEEGEEEDEEAEYEDDNAPFDEDVTSMQQATSGGGRFAL